MPRKIAKMWSSSTKENMPNNRMPTPQLTKKWQSQAPKQPHNLVEIRQLCMLQESQVLSECQSNCPPHSRQFYSYVEAELGGSEVCQQILKIRQMSNEQVIEEMLRIQANCKWEQPIFPLNFKNDQQESSEQDQDQEKEESSQNLAMIIDRDDIELVAIGYDQTQMQQQPQQTDNQEQPQLPASPPCKQYFMNDDIFEF